MSHPGRRVALIDSCLSAMEKVRLTVPGALMLPKKDVDESA